MALDLRAIMRPLRPLDLSPIASAIQNIQAARFRNAQLQEQMRQADMQQRMQQQQLDATVRERAAAQTRWGAEQEFDKTKHADLQAHRAAGLEDVDERNLLLRQKAYGTAIGEVQDAVARRASDAELEGLQGKLQALGLSMRFATPHMDPADVQLPNLQPGADPRLFAAQVEQAAAAAAQPQEAERVLEILAPDGQTLAKIPVSRQRAEQQEAVSGALGGVADVAPAHEESAFRGAASFAPGLRGTAQEQIAQGLAIAQKQLGRDAAIRAQRAGAGRAAQRYDTQEVKAGFNRAKDTAGTFKIKEIVDSYATAEGLKAMLDAKTGVTDAVLIGYVAKLWNGGRISDKDFAISKGLMSWWQEAKTYFVTKTTGKMPEDIKARFRPLADALVTANTKKFEALNRSLEVLRDSQLTEGSRAGVEMFLRSNVGVQLEAARAEVKRIQETAAADKASAVKSGRSLLKQLGKK